MLNNKNNQKQEQQITVIVGTQWGDEGKGKIVDWLSEQADAVL